MIDDALTLKVIHKSYRIWYLEAGSDLPYSYQSVQTILKRCVVHSNLAFQQLNVLLSLAYHINLWLIFSMNCCAMEILFSSSMRRDSVFILKCCCRGDCRWSLRQDRWFLASDTKSELDSPWIAVLIILQTEYNKFLRILLKIKISISQRLIDKIKLRLMW